MVAQEKLSLKQKEELLDVRAEIEKFSGGRIKLGQYSSYHKRVLNGGLKLNDFWKKKRPVSKTGYVDPLEEINTIVKLQYSHLLK